MRDDTPTALGALRVDEAKPKSDVDEVVRSSVEETVVEMHLAGVSVRRVEDITETLWGTWVSSGTVLRLN